MCKVLYPPEDMLVSSAPAIFLAGPIQGAPRWQDRAIELLSDQDVLVANPRSPEPWHGDWNGQVAWETYWLHDAARDGCILFWFANPESGLFGDAERAYAQTSRFELGEWYGRRSNSGEKYNIVVGIEPGFSNERYFRWKLERVTVPVVDSLEETVNEAISRL